MIAVILIYLLCMTVPPTSPIEYPAIKHIMLNNNSNLEDSKWKQFYPNSKSIESFSSQNPLRNVQNYSKSKQNATIKTGLDKGNIISYQNNLKSPLKDASLKNNKVKSTADFVSNVNIRPDRIRNHSENSQFYFDENDQARLIQLFNNLLHLNAKSNLVPNESASARSSEKFFETTQSSDAYSRNTFPPIDTLNGILVRKTNKVELMVRSPNKRPEIIKNALHSDLKTIFRDLEVVTISDFYEAGIQRAGSYEFFTSPDDKKNDVLDFKPETSYQSETTNPLKSLLSQKQNGDANQLKLLPGYTSNYNGGDEEGNGVNGTESDWNSEGTKFQSEVVENDLAEMITENVSLRTELFASPSDMSMADMSDNSNDGAKLFYTKPSTVAPTEIPKGIVSSKTDYNEKFARIHAPDDKNHTTHQTMLKMLTENVSPRTEFFSSPSEVSMAYISDNSNDAAKVYYTKPPTIAPTEIPKGIASSETDYKEKFARIHAPDDKNHITAQTMFKMHTEMLTENVSPRKEFVSSPTEVSIAYISNNSNDRIKMFYTKPPTIAPTEIQKGIASSETDYDEKFARIHAPDDKNHVTDQTMLKMLAENVSPRTEIFSSPSEVSMAYISDNSNDRAKIFHTKPSTVAPTEISNGIVSSETDYNEKFARMHAPDDKNRVTDQTMLKMLAEMLTENVSPRAEFFSSPSEVSMAYLSANSNDGAKVYYIEPSTIAPTEPPKGVVLSETDYNKKFARVLEPDDKNHVTDETWLKMRYRLLPSVKPAIVNKDDLQPADFVGYTKRKRWPVSRRPIIWTPVKVPQILARNRREIDPVVAKNILKTLDVIDQKKDLSVPYDGCCYNGGTCYTSSERKGQLGSKFHWCSCPKEFTGRYCEVDVNECAIPNICKEHETCVNIYGGFKCKCAENFVREGDGCIPKTTCEELPCLNGANCFDTAGGHFKCVCPLGFLGRICEIPVPECEDSSCTKDEICVSMETGFQCLNKDKLQV